MNSTSDVALDVDEPRSRLGVFDRVNYDEALVRAPTAFLNGHIPVRVGWLYGSLSWMLVKEEHSAVATQILLLKRCQLTATALPR